MFREALSAHRLRRCAWGGIDMIRMGTLLSSAVVAVLGLSGATASAQVSCTGLAAFATCKAYPSGTAVTFNGSKYTALAPITATRDCPPTSPYNPSTDNWWTNNGTCSGSAT